MFRRQEELKDFDQEKLTDEIVLVLGVGGIGTNVAIGLVRLGVKRIILVDKDIVEDHNLNRQQLYSREDIGKNKVEAAKACLEARHNIRTQIDAHHMDALVNWKTIVALAREATVVFNTIDHGDKFDVCVGALCHKLRIPMMLGGTEPFYGHLFSTFCQYVDGPCYSCVHDYNEPPLDVSKIEEYDDISFVPHDNHPDVGGSTTYSASMCSQMLLSQYVTNRMRQDGFVQRHTVIMSLINLDLTTFVNEKSLTCMVCSGQ